MALYIALRQPFPLALPSLNHALLYSYTQAGNTLTRNKYLIQTNTTYTSKDPNCPFDVKCLNNLTFHDNPMD